MSLIAEAFDLSETAASAVAEAKSPQPRTMGENVDLFTELDNVQRDLEERLKDVKKAKASVEKPLIEEMALSGVSNFRSKRFGVSIFISKRFVVSKGADKNGWTKDVVCGILKRNGYGYLVKEEEGYSAASLKAAIVEVVKDQGVEGVPKEVRDCLYIAETEVLTSRKG